MQNKSYDIIGKGYNTTRRADSFISSRLSYLLGLEKNKKYLDIGCGTGNYTILLANGEFKFYGIDPSDKMIRVAQSKNSYITWLQGTAEQIPLNNETIDGIIATLTIHHWTNLEISFQEIKRVLNEIGRVVLFTSTPEQMKGYWLNHYFPRMLEISIEQMPSLETIHHIATTVGFTSITTENYFVRDDLQDSFLYVGKDKPDIYLSEEFRQGISSFTLFSNESELKNGLLNLSADIRSGKFKEIQKQYDNELGDYLFISMRKKGSA